MRKEAIMAFPYTVIGPGGQPFIVGQIPLIQQTLAPQIVTTSVQVQVAAPQPMPPPPQPQPQPLPPPQTQPKVPDYMSEEKLQEKGTEEC